LVNRLIAITLIALFLPVVCGSAASCTALPTSPERAILGKWQTPELGERPQGGSLDPRLWDKFKEASKSQTYTLEFLKDGEVLYSSKTSIDAGTYRFIGDDHVEITWDVLGEAFWTMFGGRVYKVQISGDKMTLEKEGKSVTFRRVR